MSDHHLKIQEEQPAKHLDQDWSRSTNTEAERQVAVRDLALMIGKSAQCLSSYESGRVAPTVNILGRINAVARDRGLDGPVWC